MTTITFDERKWGLFAIFVLFMVIGLSLSIWGTEINHAGRAWVGGLFCGFSLSAWAAFLIRATSSTNRAK